MQASVYKKALGISLFTPIFSHHFEREIRPRYQIIEQMKTKFCMHAITNDIEFVVNLNISQLTSTDRGPASFETVRSARSPNLNATSIASFGASLSCPGVTGRAA